MRATHGLLLSAALAASLGCGARPRAPALGDSSVYQNEREGFRFLVPEGWSEQARADLPPGPASVQRLLVLYRSFQSKPLASFGVTLIDLPESADLRAHLTGLHRGVRWQAEGEGQALEVHGVPATRFLLRGKEGRHDLMREVVAFRRGGRTYFFIGTFGKADPVRRAQVREAVDSVLWSK
jgi:hypothetical protein